MANKFGPLIERSRRLTSLLPEEWVEKLVSVLMSADTRDWEELHSRMVNAIPKSSVQQQVSEFLDYWRTEAPEICPESLALALLTADRVNKYHRQRQQIELVWTGPTSQVIPMRRTDQTLLQLIREAEKNLLIVSFAVYRIKTIVEELVAAAERGVSITILVESPDESEGRIAYDAIQSFGPQIRSQARFYIWPKDQRQSTQDGRQGSLHAKIAVADGKSLFISSANLTEYAMHLNMELGVLITGGLLPGQVESHFISLMQKGVIRSIAT